MNQHFGDLFWVPAIPFLGKRPTTSLSQWLKNPSHTSTNPTIHHRENGGFLVCIYWVYPLLKGSLVGLNIYGPYHFPCDFMSSSALTCLQQLLKLKILKPIGILTQNHHLSRAWHRFVYRSENNPVFRRLLWVLMVLVLKAPLF